MNDELVAEDIKDERGRIKPEIKARIEKEIKELMFNKGFDWNMTELARKYKIQDTTIKYIRDSILDIYEDGHYDRMQIARLEKNRQLLLEELADARQKGKTRTHITKELRETEKDIHMFRVRMGLSENKEVQKFEEIGKQPIEIVVNMPKEKKKKDDA